MIVTDIILTILPYLAIPNHLDGVRQGILAALVFIVGLFLIRLLPKYQWLIATILLIIITPIALAGFWFSDGPLGISDWDYYFSYHHILRQSVLHYHVFPFWNPYTCGGTAGLADPEFPVLNPTFLLELLFGIPAGMRLVIYTSTATLAVGMLRLGKRLNMNVWGALGAALVAAFGSVNLLEIVEGHQNILTAMWLPWMLLHWYNAYQTKAKKSIIWCGIFLALMFYGGGIYLLMYTTLAFIGLIALSRNRKQAILVSVFAGIIALGLAGIKLVPVMDWLSEFQDKAYASSTYTLPYLNKILLGRYLHGADVIPNQGSGWHEYGAYIGPFVLVLSILGAAFGIKKRLIQALIISAVAAILVSSTGPYLKPFFDHAAFLPRSSITRFILYAIIPLSLLGGFALDRLTTFKRQGYLIGIVLLGLIAVDLFSLSYPLSQQAFVLPRVINPPAPASAPIAYSAFDYKTRYNGDDFTRGYEATLKGYGSLSYCSVLGPDPAVRTIHDEEDNAIISLSTLSTNKHEGSYRLIDWNPNRVSVEVTVPQASNVILNANYARGWVANGQAAHESSGRVSTTIPASTRVITFVYKTPGFIAGLLLTLLTSIALAVYGIRYAMSPVRKNT